MSTINHSLPTNSDEQVVLPAEPKTFHSRVMVGVAVVTVAGCCWLISSGHGVEEGHKAWATGSVLQTITSLMALNFEYPTRTGAEVKWLVQGLGAAVALLVAVTAWYVRRRPRDEEGLESDAPVTMPEVVEHVASRGLRGRPAWDLAAMAMLALTGWMMLSSLWSPWWEAALGEGVRQLIFTIWALALGRTLVGRGIRQAAAGLVVVLAITAVIGIWYHIERNPMQRLKFPIGNPNFLAACLVPGIAVVIGWAVGGLGGWLRPAPGGASISAARSWVRMIGGAASLVAMLWALRLTDARGAQLGLVCGLVVVLVTAVLLWLRGWSRRGVLLAIGAFAVAAVLHLHFVGMPGFIARRASTVEFRQHAWSYAWRLFLEQPIVGHGQASYGLLAQRYATIDARQNPQIFMGDVVGHAHNEWLEILAELGVVGFALIAATLLATMWCAVVAAREARDWRDRGLAVGLGVGLVALVATEGTDVALHMPGLPVIFYTVIGLIWAQARAVRPPVVRARSLSKGLCWIGLAGGFLGTCAVAVATEQDWRGALAKQAAATSIEKGQWDDALGEAMLAGTMRLSVEARLAAWNDFNLAAYLAAVRRWEQMSEMIGRLDLSQRVSPDIVSLAKEDANAFAYYAGNSMASGELVLRWMPTYPAIAGRLAEVLVLWQNVELVEQKLGLRTEMHSYLDAARRYLQAEFDRDPTNTSIGLRLLQMSTKEPVAARLRMLLEMFRGGPRQLRSEAANAPLFERGLSLDLLSEFEPVLIDLMQDKTYPVELDKLLQGARAATTQPASTIRDSYAPEALRLVARDCKLRRFFAEAAELADQAVGASEKITDRFRRLPPERWSIGPRTCCWLSRITRKKRFYPAGRPSPAGRPAAIAGPGWP